MTTQAETGEGPSDLELWNRFCEFYLHDQQLGFSLDVSRVRFDAAYLESMLPAIREALKKMARLEAGDIANPDENRRVGHYWLRAPQLAPSADEAEEIQNCIRDVLAFRDKVLGGQIQGARGPFRNLLHIGIGGSALGPQLMADALGDDAGLRVFFLDNTDPEGFDRTLGQLEGQLGQTLVTVVSKSGGTPEPRNAMLEVMAAYQAAGLVFADHAVAITQADSHLEQRATDEKWVSTFPIWDWVGGRTSVTSAVGLLPAALLGIDVQALLEGAAAMDQWTRGDQPRQNPAAMLALMWHFLGNGLGEKSMVIIPYKDRLALFSRYMQQLVMESLGKQVDRHGATVHQGIAVYGNKGSTDQHAYIQQLREGPVNFFATFIEVLRDRHSEAFEVEPQVTSGDYLFGFLQGTRSALYDNGRDSITITLQEVSPAAIGALIALFERTVGLYAELIDINAYNQPGVEAGKKAAAAVLQLQTRVMDQLKQVTTPVSAEQVAADLGEEPEVVFHLLRHLASNPDRRVRMELGDSPRSAVFQTVAASGP